MVVVRQPNPGRHAYSVCRPLMMMCMGVAGVVLSSPLWNGVKSPPQGNATAPQKSLQKRADIPWGDRAYDTQVVVDLSDRVVYVYREQKILSSYRIAIGQRGWETPIGTFRVRQMLKNPAWQHPITDEVFPPGDLNPLGDRWVGFAADEHMKLGFHGTKDEKLIGQAVSHGCLRMKNREVRLLFDQVSIGTIVTVRP